jgi:hypothetical protein
MIRIMVILLVGLFVMNSILIQGISLRVEDLHQARFPVPKNVPEADERRVHDPSCQELAETEQEYELCKRLRQRYDTPIIVDPRGTRSIGELVERGEVTSVG